MPAAHLPRMENAHLAFIGEAMWLPACLTARQAKIFSATPNPAGRPNSDVLRTYVGKSERRLREHWQIDFPAHYREQEAALHELPFALLQKNLEPKTDDWWINPYAQLPLRHALARLDRFLATALDAPKPTWTWFESEHLPDASLLVIARDDDFTHAVLASSVFTIWWHAYQPILSATQIIESFPFPWPPATPLGALTKTQQDLRSAAARAVLVGDTEQINSAIAAAYSWPDTLDESKIFERLQHLPVLRCAG